MLVGLILVAFLTMLVSLAMGYWYFVNDKGDNSKFRLLTALKFRVSIAIIMLSLVIYGFVSGQFHSQAPWDKRVQLLQLEPK